MTLATDHPLHDEGRDVLKAVALLGAFFFAAALGAYLYALDWRAAIPRDGSTLVVGRDFLNIWMFGRAALTDDPGRWYDAALYQRALAEFVGAGYPGQNWSYPPSVMLLAAPFGQIGYLPALLAWTLLGLAIFLPVAARQLNDHRALVALALSPAAVFCLISGQSALLTTAMLIAIFTQLDRRPLMAGALIGLLTLKPQLGVLFPFILIASGRWRVFFVAAATAIAIAALSIALFGIKPWVDFIQLGLPTQNIVLHDAGGIATPYYTTIFMNLRGIGAPYALAMAVQLCFLVAAIAAVMWAFRMRRDANWRVLFALFAACSISAVPYLLAYDTLPLAFAALALLAANQLDTRGQWLARGVYWLPLLQIGLGTLHIPGAALIPPAFALYVIAKLRSTAEHARMISPRQV